ncbi:hypothetical protein ILYODFUR_035402 [Ilyodon furcidens]|uniref:Uncharacterized protein n=1 Tax=Ilyodon furcidens TaxID=33524 RepID=A0ABV0TGB2_9TELE
MRAPICPSLGHNPSGSVNHKLLIMDLQTNSSSVTEHRGQRREVKGSSEHLKEFSTTLLSSDYKIITKKGKFYKTITKIIIKVNPKNIQHFKINIKIKNKNKNYSNLY